jgi:putative FmdB family regulatory protein
MPIYEYQCHGCGQKFEVIQKFSDEPLATHEDCGGKVERLLGSPALQFKGSGWYITDYAKDGGKKDSAPATKDSGGASTESKPAADSKPAASTPSGDK